MGFANGINQKSISLLLNELDKSSRTLRKKYWKNQQNLPQDLSASSRVFVSHCRIAMSITKDKVRVCAVADIEMYSLFAAV